MSYITCRRCSVLRVNTLCQLYEKAYEGEDRKAREDLTKLVQLALDRGYTQGRILLQPGLARHLIRPICWNVSSVLTDNDLEAMGYKA